MPPQSPMTPSPFSAAPPPSPTPKPLLEIEPGLLGSVEGAEEVGAVEEQVLAVAEEEEAGRLREGDAFEGFTSVVKQGPYRLRQLPFFFFFAPSSPPDATPPIAGPELEDWGRL